MLIHGLSLCSGVEGLGRGLAAVLPNLRTVAYCEIDPFCQTLLCARMDDGWLDRAPIWPDLRTFDGRPWRGRVDLVFGGPPCQGFSVAGKRRGEHDSRNLLPDTLRVIRECEPAGVFLENVPGALPYFFHVVLPELQAMGYRTAAGLFRASDVGASHRRERLFVLADRAGERWDGLGLHVRPGGSYFWTTPQAHDAAGDALGDALGAGLALGPEPDDGRGTLRHEGTPAGAPSDGDLPAWPPGPTERERWAEVLERWPELAPAMAVTPRQQVGTARQPRAHAAHRSEAQPDVLRVVDESALFLDGRCPWCGSRVRSPEGHARMHRLKALGNAVVPACAAYAFVTLMEDLDAAQRRGK